MNKLFKISIGIIFLIFSVSCDSLLDVDSDSLAFPEDNQLNSADDQIYSMVGIFSQLEKLAVPYVVLGELRGDLMDITDNADIDLQEIYNHEVSEGNVYNVKSDYYSVINNCNYLIHNVDTSLTVGVDKVLLQEYAAAKAIRAWTYMQLVQNYGKVKYIEQPLLTIQEAEGDFPEYTMEELASVLIEDLIPYVDVEYPDYISLGEITTAKSYFPISFLLGDLYLWTRQYEAAASMYYDLIDKDFYRVSYYIRRDADEETESEFTNVIRWNWLNYFDLSVTGGKVSLIAGSSEFGEGSLLDTLAFGAYAICPSEVAKSNWQNQIYYHSATLFTGEGNDYIDVDLRGRRFSYYTDRYYTQSSSASGYGALPASAGVNKGVIQKYMNMSTETSKAINIIRTPMLYLRYAEAVNRAGKPNLAFAVLKNGLKAPTLAVDSLIPRREKYVSYTDTTHGGFISYVDFSDDKYGTTIDGGNIGVHSQGCGNTWYGADYKIDSLNTLLDSIEFVENKIIEELALETAFEGNRFQDLMRVAKRRGDNSYLADKVAKKYTAAGKSLSVDLTTEENWYLP